MLGLASAGCGASSFVEVGERTRPATGRVRGSDTLDLETVSWPAPTLSAQPPDVLAGEAVPLIVEAHDAVRGVFRLTLRPETGEPLRLEYRLAASRAERLPVEVGEELLWRLPLDSRLEPTGLLVQERDGTLRAVVVLGETLGSFGETLGSLGISADFSASSLVYSETTAVMSCLIGVDHHALRVSDGGTTLWVRPGTSRLVELTDLPGRPRVRFPSSQELAAETFELLVFDVSRPTTGDEDPRCARRAHVSWALLRAAGD